MPWVGSDGVAARAFPDALKAAQAGVESGFAALYRDYNPRLLRYFVTRAGQAGEDLAADTWLAAAKGLGRFDGDERAFRAWLFTIARRRLIEHWRMRGRDRVCALTDDLKDFPALGDGPAESTVESLSAQEAARLIVAKLSPAQGEVILLRVLGGLEVDQVATILGKRPETVRVLQHRALRRLASEISHQATVVTP
jgi:RNA polymerase sigma-70 factor (ECF subfamily)